MQVVGALYRERWSSFFHSSMRPNTLSSSSSLRSRVEWRRLMSSSPAPSSPFADSFTFSLTKRAGKGGTGGTSSPSVNGPLLGVPHPQLSRPTAAARSASSSSPNPAYDPTIALVSMLAWLSRCRFGVLGPVVVVSAWDWYDRE